MRELRGNQALREALIEAMADDERVFLLGEDIGRHGGVFRVTEGLLERFGPQRVIDSPISESGIVGVGVGAALLGMRPVVEIQFTDLVTIAMDQIVNSAAKARYVHEGRLGAPLVIRTVNLGKGTVYASQAREAWFAHVPGLKVVMPADPQDAKGLLATAIRDDNPVVFIEHLTLYGLHGPVPEQRCDVPLGTARIRRAGGDVTIVAWGGCVPLAEDAAMRLAGEGVDAEVLDLRTLVPFDRDAVVASVCRTGRLVIVHEAVQRCGFGAEVAASVVDSMAFDHLQAPIVRVANPGVPVPHSRALHALALPSADDVVDAVRRVVGYG